ncbi:MAG: transglycosylase SLT domain-containing protein [bacterium]
MSLRHRIRPMVIVQGLFFACAVLVIQGCAVSHVQMKDPEQFSHTYLSEEQVTTLVPSRGKTLDEYISPNFRDPNIQETRMIFQQGWHSFERKEWDEAMGWFAKSFREYPYLKDYATFYMALCLENKGQYDDAIALLNEIITTWPESILIPRVQLKLGDIHFCAGDYRNAIEAYKKASELLPSESVYSRFQIGISYMEMEEWESALEGFRFLLIHEPSSDFTKVAHNYILRIHRERNLGPFQLSAEDTFRKAEILYKRRCYDAAIEAYRSVICARPRFPEYCRAMFKLAQSYKRTGRRDLSIETLQEMVRTLPESECVFDARLFLARILWNDHRNSEARRHLDHLAKVRTSWGNRAEVLYILGRMAEEENHLIDAVEYYQKVLDLGAGNPYYRNVVWRIGWVYYMGGYYRHALNHIDHHLSRVDDVNFRQQLLYWKARIEEKRGKPEGAVEAYREILKEPYWSFYSGLTEIWLGCQDDPNNPACVRPDHEVEEMEEDPALLLDEREKNIVNRVMELWLLGFRDDSIREIRHYAYAQEKVSPELLFCLSSIAHMNGAHDLGIRIGIIHKQRMKSQETSLGKPDDLLIYPLGYSSLVQEKARDYNIDPILVLSVIRQESLFDPVALSSSSAYGLMQIIPSTGNAIARELGVDIASDLDMLFDPELNVTFGCFFLKGLLDRFDQNMVYALASYNAGPGAVTRWQDRFGHLEVDEFIESIPYYETRDYVKRIMKNYWMYKRMYTPLKAINTIHTKEVVCEEDPHSRR